MTIKIVDIYALIRTDVTRCFLNSKYIRIRMGKEYLDKFEELLEDA